MPSPSLQHHPDFASLRAFDDVDADRTGYFSPYFELDPPSYSTFENGSFDSSDSILAPADVSSLAMVRVPEQPLQAPGVQWGQIAKGSLAALAVMNGYRIGTEPSTRLGLHNGLVGGYFKALGAMHGWSDGDGYYENYLGHPIEGATAAYIWIHNDPRYRTVEFGKGRDYWMSRLRAYAFAWAFSEQFEIGPLSEASIGQIQRNCCAYGFVDHVMTPNGGMFWLIGGDILDKYVTRRIEDHTRNQWVRAAARVAFNFPQTFANVVNFETPWHRDNRPGVRDYDGQLYPRFNVVPENSEGNFQFPQVPRFELSAAIPSYMRWQDHSCVGGGGTGAFRLSDTWQWTAEVGGCTMIDLPQNWSGDSLTFTTGPQWIRHGESRWTPYAHIRLGGQKITEEYIDPVLKQKAMDELPPGGNLRTVHDTYAKDFETIGMTLSIGGGVDVAVNRALAVRLGSIDYMHSWLGQINGDNFNQGFRVSTGLVLRVGTW